MTIWWRHPESGSKGPFGRKASSPAGVCIPQKNGANTGLDRPLELRHCQIAGRAAAAQAGLVVVALGALQVVVAGHLQVLDHDEDVQIECPEKLACDPAMIECTSHDCGFFRRAG